MSAAAETSGQAAAPAAGPSRIPCLTLQSPGSRPGRSSIPSPARAAASTSAQARKVKSILAQAPAALHRAEGADVTPGWSSDQTAKQAQLRKGVPSLDLAGVSRALDVDPAATTPSATASKSPVMGRRTSCSPTRSANSHTTPSSKPLKSHARISASPDTSKRRNSKGAATKVVFGRALAPSPRVSANKHPHATASTGASRAAQTGSFAMMADSVLDRASRQSRCASALKVREPASGPTQAQRSVSVDKSRPAAISAASRSMSVEKTRQVFGKGDSKFRATSPSPANRAADVKATAVSSNAVRATVALAAIPEAPRAVASAGGISASAAPATIKPSAPVSANVNPRPVKPSFSLNLAAVKQAAEQPTDGPLSGSSSMTSQVPKLNLTPVLQQREEEQGSQQAYKVAPAAPEPKPQTKSQSKPPEEPMDHYYYYPKLDSKEERKTMELISSLPRQPATQMKKIYSAMVEAKQNCEAIAFRGHRLLDQLNMHMQEKLAKKDEEMAETLRAVEEEMARKLAAKEDEAKRKEEELRQQAEEFQRIKDEHERKITALYRQLQSAHTGDAKLGSAGGDSEATASALRDLQSMSANICSMNDSVNQLSSRLGGVAVRPGARGGAGAAAGGAGGLSGVDFMRELMKLGGPPAGAGGKVTGGLQAMEDDRQQVKDIDC